MLHHYEATHMNSSEGEKVQFKAPVRLEGVVEGWLCVVENMMHKSLRDVLRACRLDLKKHLSKREKWVRDWPGQVIITASQIQWTADCEKALDRGDKKGLKSIRKKQTSSNNVQEIIEGKVEKRTKGVYVPVGGKKLLTYLDDLNMPAKDEYGSQPPLELVRQWIDYGF
jgi:dynein heavy chain